MRSKFEGYDIYQVVQRDSMSPAVFSSAVLCPENVACKGFVPLTVARWGVGGDGRFKGIGIGAFRRYLPSLPNLTPSFLPNTRTRTHTLR